MGTKSYRRGTSRTDRQWKLPFPNGLGCISKRLADVFLDSLGRTQAEYTPLAYHPGVVIVETGTFTATIRTFLKEEEYRRLQSVLAGRPDLGVVIPGTGGLRKLRWGGSGRGKRGGIRVIYYWHQPTARILMLLAYAKNERDDLSERQKQTLRRIIDTEYP